MGRQYQTARSKMHKPRPGNPLIWIAFQKLPFHNISSYINKRHLITAEKNSPMVACSGVNARATMTNRIQSLFSISVMEGVYAPLEELVPIVAVDSADRKALQTLCQTVSQIAKTDDTGFFAPQNCPWRCKDLALQEFFSGSMISPS